MKKLILAWVLLMIVLPAYQAQVQSPLATLAASMQSGSWAELSVNGFPVLFQPGSNGNILDYAADGGWDPIGRRLYFVGNDHIDGNLTQALRFVVYDEVTNTLQNLSPPPFSQAGSTNHGYYHHAVNPANGDLYRRSAKGSEIISRYRAGVWTNLPPMPQEDSRPGYGPIGAMDYFPELGGLVLAQGGEFGGGSVYLFSEATQQWTKLADNLPGLDGPTFTAGAYSAVAKVFVFGQNAAFYKLDANRVVTRIADPPITFYNGSSLAMFSADPISGRFIALASATRQMVSYDIVANVWATLNSINQPTTQNLFTAIAVPISNHGVTMYIGCYIQTCHAYLYKYAASTQTPTPTPAPTPTPTTTVPTVPTTFQALQMTTKTAGAAYGTVGWNLYSNGYVESSANFPSTGTYRFTVNAFGTQAAGVWPNMDVNIDGLPVGTRIVNTPTFSSLTIDANVVAGVHRVAVAFTNDFFVSSTEDRNLVVDTVAIAFIGTAPTPTPTPGVLPLGPLTHDGPPTPEQLSLLLPVTGVLPQTATVTVNYKPTGSIVWRTGHPLFRIQPSFSETPAVGTVIDAFAWPIIDLQPCTSHDVEVTVKSGATTEVKTATFTTRCLPATAGPANKTITAGSSQTTIQSAFDALVPGDVIQFQDSTYNACDLIIRRNGTTLTPIVIRGASRAGVVLSCASRIIQIQNAANVVLENFTLKGSGVDSGNNVTSIGIEFYDGTPNQSRITVRNVTMTGVDRAISQYEGITETLIYDNTFTGNNLWMSAFTDTSIGWNDDGINLGGIGNVAFNNTLKGFGDCLSYVEHSSGNPRSTSRGVHFYRNDLRNCVDDMAEADHSLRNNTLYDNRSHNSMTFTSFDPLYGGPFLDVRNVVINTGRTPFKWNSTNSGQFVLNNTIIRTTGRYQSTEPAAEAGWYQANNGDQRAYGYQNNIMVYRGVGSQMIRLDNSGHTPVDFSHNSWFPDLVFQWPQGRFANLAAAYGGLSATTSVFSGFTKRHEQDNIIASNPWTDIVTLGADYKTEVTQIYTPILTAGPAKNSGITIPNVTDGFSGVAPDRGALISGRTIPIYGDRSALVPTPTPTPTPTPIPAPTPTTGGTIKATGTFTDANGASKPVTIELTIKE